MGCSRYREGSANLLTGSVAYFAVDVLMKDKDCMSKVRVGLDGVRYTLSIMK